MKLFLGIDGGGTHTTACLGSRDGQLLAKTAGGVGNPNHASEGQLEELFRNLLRDLAAATGASITDIASVYAGMAGVTTEDAAACVNRALTACGIGHAKLGIDHDIRIALAGGLAGRPGMALIVGTGSSCYGRTADGQTWQSGGWGSLISDEGSGYYLGREAITAAVRMADGRQPDTRLREVVFHWLGINSVSEVMDRIYGHELSRPEIASFAPDLIELADNGDPAALGILASGTRELAEMVAANHNMLPTADEPEIVITGGLGSAETCYRTMIWTAIKRLLPAAKLTEAEMSPETGAVMLAIEQDSGSLTPQIIKNLKGNS